MVTLFAGSADDCFDGLAMIDREAFASGHFQAMGVEAHLVEDGRVDVGDVVAVLGRVEAEFVGRAVGDAPFDPAAGEPD